MSVQLQGEACQTGYRQICAPTDRLIVWDESAGRSALPEGEIVS